MTDDNNNNDDDIFEAPAHPGTWIKSILDANKLSIQKASKQLSVDRQTLSKLVHCGSGVSVDMAIRLEIWVGSSSKCRAAINWLNAQARYDLWMAEQKIDYKNIQPLNYLG